jgi:hypothetical protein
MFHATELSFGSPTEAFVPVRSSSPENQVVVVEGMCLTGNHLMFYKQIVGSNTQLVSAMHVALVVKALHASTELYTVH